jgi:hypothetical protein
MSGGPSGFQPGAPSSVRWRTRDVDFRSAIAAIAIQAFGELLRELVRFFFREDALFAKPDGPLQGVLVASFHALKVWIAPGCFRQCRPWSSSSQRPPSQPSGLARKGTAGNDMTAITTASTPIEVRNR